ncbi:GGDEF domain-containing protein [Polynucleobacter tropicus]|uniref:GGDEF domain-containing protein n=1 Tax=Polynucleobacter tropicus TaxID=1743174 RepID=UPI00156D7863|nr:GGDEF domain-containing protein [Polynucleobacter tropicus]
MLKQFQNLFEQLQKLAHQSMQDGSVLEADADRQLTPLQRHILRELLEGRPAQPQIVRDELTGLLVRSSLLERLDQALGGSSSRDSILALCFIDLDGFKQINDQHGHAIGDQALSLVGQRLQNSIRSDDLLCRWGGDEFVVVLQNIDHQKSVEHLADRLLNAISHPLRLSADEPLTLFLGASIGVSILAPGVLREKLDALGLIESADQAMYKAKRAGKNRIEITA